MDKPPGQRRQIETLVFLDLESTGLPDLMPRRKVNVTEVALIAVPRKLLRTPLRCLHRLSFCVQPRNAVTLDAANITGLDNWDLQWCPSFGEIAEAVEKFLYTLQPPICLVAHNGDKFDFPLLRAELKHSAPGIDLTAFFCCDSLPAFREILGNAADPQEVSEVLALGEIDNEFWEAFEAADITSASDSDEQLLSQPVERPTHQTPQNKALAYDGNPPPPKKRREESGQHPQLRQSEVRRRLDFSNTAPLTTFCLMT
uniref:Deddh 3' 5' exonuclease domain of three prime repair exonuclease n=1 Tax=Rhipicephalus appendiculatus TaxID=34631 RepID=A0A131YH80_RHIAP